MDGWFVVTMEYGGEKEEVLSGVQKGFVVVAVSDDSSSPHTSRVIHCTGIVFFDDRAGPALGQLLIARWSRAMRIRTRGQPLAQNSTDPKDGPESLMAWSNQSPQPMPFLGRRRSEGGGPCCVHHQ